MQNSANVLVLELPGLEIVGTRIRVTGKTGMVAQPHPGFSEMRALARPGPQGRPKSSALHDFARSGPTKEAHRRAIYSSGGLLRSVAGQGHGRVLPVTLPRGASDQAKRAEAGHDCPSPPEGPIKGGVEGPIKGGSRDPWRDPSRELPRDQELPHSRQKDRVD